MRNCVGRWWTGTAITANHKGTKVTKDERRILVVTATATANHKGTKVTKDGGVQSAECRESWRLETGNWKLENGKVTDGGGNGNGDGKQGRFFFDEDELGRLARRFVEEYPEAAREVVRYADRVCGHVFDLLGSGERGAECGVRNAECGANGNGNDGKPQRHKGHKERKTGSCYDDDDGYRGHRERRSAECRVQDETGGERIDWYADVMTGRRWRGWPSALLLIGKGDGVSDIKRVWELSRCQHFAALGIAHAIADEIGHREQRESTKSSIFNHQSSIINSSSTSVASSAYAREWVREMLDWDRANPPLVGPNWMVAMEAAIRIVNWIWGYFFMRDSAAFDDEARRVFYKSLLSHGRFIVRHVEPYGNHRLSCFVGLIFLGVLFPEFREAAQWREVGLRGFCEELKRQVRPDGCHFEGSIPYHRLVLEMAATTWLLLERNGIELPAEARGAISAADRGRG